MKSLLVLVIYFILKDLICIQKKKFFFSITTYCSRSELLRKVSAFVLRFIFLLVLFCKSQIRGGRLLIGLLYFSYLQRRLRQLNGLHWCCKLWVFLLPFVFIVLYSVFLSIFFSIAVFLTAFFVSSRFLMDREKISPFECGFDPKGSARLPFSMRFFLLAVIFLIFDVEIALLIPFPVFIFYGFRYLGFFCCFSFIFILVFGVFHEWNEGSLDWIGWSNVGSVLIFLILIWVVRLHSCFYVFSF